MKDDWEIKKVVNSGSDTWIKVGPKDANEGGAILICAGILTLTSMSLLGLVGGWWFAALYVLFLVIGILFPVAVIGAAMLTVVIFLFGNFGS